MERLLSKGTVISAVKVNRDGRQEPQILVVRAAATLNNNGELIALLSPIEDRKGATVVSVDYETLMTGGAVKCLSEKSGSSLLFRPLRED